MIGDKSFGINCQALAVLEFLSQIPPSFANYKEGRYEVYFETHPWYNGRERGFVLTMFRSYMSKRLHIAVYEHRNTEDIDVLRWETTLGYWNGANYDIVGKEAYLGKDTSTPYKSFGYGQIGEVVNWIYSELEEFYNKNGN